MNFRRQVDKPVRQHLPTNESSACFVSLIDGLCFPGLWSVGDEVVGFPTAFFVFRR